VPRHVNVRVDVQALRHLTVATGYRAREYGFE
jgi:hypothetical protein